jgi:hypothetical protein
MPDAVAGLHLHRGPDRRGSWMATVRSQPPIDWDEEWAKVQREEAEALRAERDEYREPFPWLPLVVLAGYLGMLTWAVISWALDS